MNRCRSALLGQQLLSGPNEDLCVFLRIASTLLENRAETGNRQSLDLLLNRGADTGARDKWGRSVLQLASASGDITIVSSLLGAGVDIDTPGDRGMEDTALNMAVRKR